MGSPLSPVVADIFMEEFEQKALESTRLKPKLWLRYVDDVLVIWPHGEKRLRRFLKHLNSQHDAIKFTLEEEKDGRLPFLDTLLTRKEDGTIGHTVYRKPTASGRYIHADSHHHPSQKVGVIKTLAIRAKRLCDTEVALSKELDHIKQEFLQNGYTKQVISKAIRESAKINEEAEKEKKEKVFLPYVAGVSEIIQRKLRPHNLEAVFKPYKKIGDMMESTKDKFWLQESGVYSLPCDCGKAYIGQTGKKIVTRLGQHLADYKHRRTKTSAVAKHGEECRGQLMFDKASCLARETNLDRRLIREAIEIWKRPRNINIDCGIGVAGTWIPALSRHTRRMEPPDPPVRSLPLYKEDPQRSSFISTRTSEGTTCPTT